jgi:hypothetical protein
MLTILQELNIDCFQGYGNSYCKDYIIRVTFIRPPVVKRKIQKPMGLLDLNIKYKHRGPRGRS